MPVEVFILVLRAIKNLILNLMLTFLTKNIRILQAELWEPPHVFFGGKKGPKRALKIWPTRIHE